MNDSAAAMLQAEYLHLQKTVEDFDARTVTITAWSVSFSLVALGGAFASKAFPDFLVASLSALRFWIIEGFWKNFQYAYYRRIEVIEAYFRGEHRALQPFPITAAWSGYYAST